MNKKNFDMLMQSMREGAEILNGTREPSRRFVVEKKEDVQQVRQAFHLSQTLLPNLWELVSEQSEIGSRGVVAQRVRRAFFCVLLFVGRSYSQRRLMRSVVIVQWRDKRSPWQKHRGLCF